MITPGMGGLISGIGSALGGLFGHDSAEDNIKYQKQFAQRGIRWRVADAKAAGLHPLAAIGAQASSFSPPFTDTGGAISDAVNKAVSGFVKPDELDTQIKESTVKKLDAETDFVKQQTAASLNALLSQGRGVSPGNVPDTLHNPTEIQPQQFTPGNDTWMGRVLSDPRVGNVQSLMERYGEDLHSFLLFGLPTLARDIGYTGRQKFNRSPKALYHEDDPVFSTFE